MSDAIKAEQTETTVWENRETENETVVNPASETAPETKAETFDREYVEKLRRESAEYRTKLRNAESRTDELAKKVEAFEHAQLSEEERRSKEFEAAKDENRKLKNQARETLLEAAVAKNTVAFELADADATLQLLDKKSVEYGEDGRPTNITDVLTATLERYPFLKAASQKRQVDDPGATNPGRQKKGGSLTREAVQAMSHEERAERMPEIMKWAQNGYK